MTMADNYALIDYYPEVTRFNTVICKHCGTLVPGTWTETHLEKSHGIVVVQSTGVDPFLGTAPAAAAVDDTPLATVLDDSLAPKPGGRVRNLHD